ncbi:hypothetical protein EVG20_g4202 [Dentipellis fragilis]|uniref:F-box domain-containing protein n=1 Tax=Dentipellis fragilis TaxID=205917 RepID=A0A4Y9YZ51_9AGAM|nr:hypothetical protein EVG20_g4202 [Dentipellis fragilis]
MEEFLRRSQATPVSLSVSFSESTRGNARDVAGMISQHLYHIRNLKIDTGLLKDVASILLSLREAAPALETVELDNWPEVVRNMSMRSSSLPRDLLRCTAPRLHSLKIQEFYLPWSSLVFSTLVELKISGLFLDHADPALPAEDLRQFFGALSRMPALESLVLKAGLPSLGTASQRTCFPFVTLPNLRWLFLRDDVLKCAIVLKHLVLPPTAKQAVYGFCTSDDHNGDRSEIILPWLRSHIAALPRIHVLDFTGLQDDFNVVAYGASVEDPF